MAKTENFRRDVKIAGKSVTVRARPDVWSRFEEIAKAEGKSLSEMATRAKAAYPKHSVSSAIEMLVKLASGNQPISRYKTREAWLGALVDAMRPVFAERGYPLPAKIVATMGFPSTGWRGKRRGECWSSDMSAAGNVEIFVHPCETSIMRIANILTHELCHAADEQYYIDHPKRDKHGNLKPYKSGHGKRWTVIAHALDITEGKGTHALGGAEWEAWATPLIDACGPMPFDALENYVKKPKKQTTRMLKCECPDCGAIWRTSRKVLDAIVEKQEGRGEMAYLNCIDPDCIGRLDILDTLLGEGESDDAEGEE